MSKILRFPAESGSTPTASADAGLLEDARAGACMRVVGQMAGLGEGDASGALRVLDLALDALILVDNQRRILYANEGATALTGFSTDDLIGRRCKDGLHFETCAERCSLFDDGLVCARECTMRTKDGARLDVLKNARLLYDEDGQVVGGIESLQAAVAVESEAALYAVPVRRPEKDEREFVQALTETLSAPTAAIDPQGNIVGISPGAAELLGVSSASARGRSLLELLEDAVGLRGRIDQVLRDGTEAGYCDLLVGPQKVASLLRLRALTDTGGETLGVAVTFEPQKQSAEKLRHGLIAESQPMRDLLTAVERLAERDATVLLTGESGVGKEAVARALHVLGTRRSRPFVAVNCSALAESILESELFGHERGAFTGALERRCGRFELCRDGTLFLDEIGCLSPAAQVKLLRVLEDRTFERVGGSEPLPLCARIVAATNADLETLVAEGSFREDLYYRLRVVPLEVPPLRARPADVLPLARHFLCADGQGLAPGLSAPVQAALRAYAWPGNVRELKNVMAHALTFCDDVTILPGDLPAELAQRAEVRGTSRDAAEGEAIRRALEQAHWVKSKAATLLGISRTTLWRKMRQHGLA